MRSELSLTADPAIRATFQAQLAEARETPGLSGLVTRPAPDLYPRYADYYRQLCQLPRRVRRGLRRQWKRSLSALALLLALGQAPALAATIHVDGTNCTLADAIRSANTDAPVGRCNAGNGADRLVLAPKSTHTLTTVEDTTYGETGLPLVTSTITIVGHKSTIERGAGAPKFRLLAVSPAGKLTLEKLTLRGGDANYGGGGGIVNSGGSLTLTDCTVSDNTAYVGGGVSNGGVSQKGIVTITKSTVSGNTGGGVFNEGTLTIMASTISGNTAGYSGVVSNRGDGRLTLTNSTVSRNTGKGVSNGGFYNSGSLTIKNSTVSGNTGGGVFNGGVDNSATLTIKNSTVSSNTGYIGGGVENSGTLTLTNSTVSGNTAGLGGGVSNGGTLTLTNTTVSGNTATVVGPFGIFGDGGGVYNFGTLAVSNGTVSGNTAANRGGGVTNVGTVTLGRSLISGNTASSDPEALNVMDQYHSGTVNANNFNLFGHNGDPGVVGFLPGATDIVPTVALNRILEPLAANGGPTLTQALVRGSPAIDALEVGCPPPATDQRGLPRPVDGDGDLQTRCDIGAFEFDSRGLCPSVRPSKGCTVNGVPDQLCRGTTDDDTIVGTSRNDVILGRRGNDMLDGLAGHDLLCGQYDNDLIRGGADRDNIEGNNGEDELFGGEGNDWIKGGRGNDDLDGGSGRDRLDGQQDTDTCVNGESVRSCP